MHCKNQVFEQSQAATNFKTEIVLTGATLEPSTMWGMFVSVLRS
jgi:hypothetical protein